MFDLLKQMFVFVLWLKGPLIIVLIFLSLYGALITFWVFRYRINGMRIERGSRVFLKKKSILRRLLVDFPKQFVLDIYNRPADFFRHQGLIIYEGRQGSGKTSTMVRDTLNIMKEYPKCKVVSNLGLEGEHSSLKHWRQLVDFKNGHYGIVAVLDELQNWFSCNQSKDFPPEMLGVITQNRKNRRVIYGTAQSFHLLAKSIRSQCIEVRKCVTILGCITFVFRKEPILDSEGNVSEWKKRGMYFYVHDQELRQAYDTYKVIESLSKAGFKENNVADIYNYTNVVVTKGK